MPDVGQEWDEQSEYEIKTARYLLKGELYLYALFCGHQSVEKALKGVIARITLKLPPRYHNLKPLAEAAQLSLDEEQILFLSELSGYYLKTRYPNLEANAPATRPATRETVEDVLGKTEAFLEWLRSRRT